MRSHRLLLNVCLMLAPLALLVSLLTPLPALAQTTAPPSWGPTLTPAPAAAAAASATAANHTNAARAAVPPASPRQHAAATVADVVPVKPQPRRAVTQQLTPTPRILGSAARPLTPDAASPALRPGAAPAQGSVPATCGATGCVDVNGQRMGTGVGNAVVTPQGQLCTRGLVGVQCF